MDSPVKTNPRDAKKQIKEQHKKWREENVLKKLERAKQAADAVASAPPKQTKTLKPLSTISIAVPGSILDNAQSAELRTYLAGQIARAACIFKVDEIIVFDDNGSNRTKKSKRSKIGEFFLIIFN